MDRRANLRRGLRAPLQVVASLGLLSLVSACDPDDQEQPMQLTVGGMNDTLTASGTASSTGSATDTGATSLDTSGSASSDTGVDVTGDSGVSSGDEANDDGDQCDRGEIVCDGACIDPETNEDYCGASNECRGADQGERCQEDETCFEGECIEACPGGKVSCEGRCIDPRTDPEFCGAVGDCEGSNAGEECRSGDVCSEGRCDDECGAGQLICDDRCVDPDTDHEFCGARGDDCDDEGERCGNDEVCVKGRCEDECPRDEVACDERCIDPESDPNYCGARDECEDDDAGEVCDESEVCVRGRCEDECEDRDFIACERECINPENDPRFCGAEDDCEGNNAGEVCRMNEQCISGRCEEAGAWDDEEKVSEGDDEVEEHAIDRDDEGNVIAAYIQDGQVFAARAENGNWDRAERIDSDSDSDCRDLRLVMDGEGNALAVWIQGDRLWHQRFDADDESWENQATRIQTTSEPSLPSLAIDREDGRAMLFWVTTDVNNSSLNGTAAAYFDGDRWETARSVAGRETQDIERPHVAINGDGEAIAVWTVDRSGSNRRIVASRYDEQSGTFGWRAVQYVDSDTSDDQDYAQAYINEDGDSLAVWLRQGSDNEPHYATLESGQSARWSNAEALEGANDVQGHLRLVGTQSDTALAAWLDDEDGTTVVMASMWDGRDFEDADIVQIDDESDAEDFDVALGESGLAMIVWTQEVDRELRVLSNWRELDSSNGEWGDFAVQVDGGDEDQLQKPIVCVDDNSEAAAAWLVEGSRNHELWSASFEGERR